MFKTKKF